MIVLTTPTGHVGAHLLGLLRAAGAPVRAIARDPSRLPAGVEAVAGAHDDPTVLDAALPGADALFLLIPPDPGAATFDEHYTRFARAAAEGVVRHGVPRVVLVSTFGRGIETGAGALSSALLAEAELNRSGVHTRALRPPFFMENLLHQAEPLRAGRLLLPSAPDRILPTVATADVAAAAAPLLTDRTWTGQDGLPVAGPDDLTPEGMATILTAALGHPIAFTPITTADYHATLLAHGMPAPRADGLAAMADAQNRGAYTDDTLPATRGATSLHTWATEHLAPAVAAT